MDRNDEIFKLSRAKKWSEIHRVLDRTPQNNAADRHFVAHWRKAALIMEGRYQDALEFLQANKQNLGCQTAASAALGEILHVLGRDQEAIAELKNAPMAAEVDQYRPLVVDAKFQLAYLQALNGQPVEGELLDAIPNTYVHVSRRGKRISKSELLNLISGVADPQRPCAGSPPCGCNKA